MARNLFWKPALRFSGGKWHCITSVNFYLTNQPGSNVAGVSFGGSGSNPADAYRDMEREIRKALCFDQ